jgi:hypothetical protein
MDFFYNDSVELKSSADFYVGKNTFVLSLQEDNVTNCPFQNGFTNIHNRFDVPRFGVDSYKFVHELKESKMVDIVITPVITTTDDNLRPLNPKKLKSMNSLYFAQAVYSTDEAAISMARETCYSSRSIQYLTAIWNAHQTSP